MNKRRMKKGMILLMVGTIGMILIYTYKGWMSVIDRASIDENDTIIENNYNLILDPLVSQNILMIDADTKEIVVAKNSKSRMYPASLTKLMTVLIVLDYYDDLNQHLIVDATDIEVLKNQHASLAGFSENEEVSILDLLYGALLPSGADAVATLVHAVSSDEEFVIMMNQRAQQLGMNSTHYTNIYGFHDENHYTSASDMMILFEEALSHSILKAIMSTNSYNSTSTHYLQFDSTIFSRINQNAGLFTETLNGGKTGYTPQAGQCLVSFGGYQDKKYLIVSGGASGDNFSEPFHIQDHLYLYQAMIGL